MKDILIIKKHKTLSLLNSECFMVKYEHGGKHLKKFELGMDAACCRCTVSMVPRIKGHQSDSSMILIGTCTCHKSPYWKVSCDHLFRMC